MTTEKTGDALHSSCVTLGQAYMTELRRAIERVFKKGANDVAHAAARIADRVQVGRPVFVMGTGGHSFIAAEESFYRAGGLASVCPILDVPFNLSQGGRRAMERERTPGIMHRVLQRYSIEADDVVIICNMHGFNVASIEAALECASNKACLIAITSSEIGRHVPINHPARHASGMSLAELADIVIDTSVPMEDAAIQINKVTVPVAPVSTVVNVFCLNWIIAQVVRILSDRGVAAPVWKSASVPGGDEFNLRLIEAWGPKVIHL